MNAARYTDMNAAQNTDNKHKQYTDMNTTQHTMHYSNNSTALRKDGHIGKAVVMALLAILLVVPATLRAQSDTEPATITLTAYFNEEYYSVGTPSGYTAYYTTDGTEPTSASNSVTNSQISVADLANGTTITVIAINNTETTAVATATVERYLAPVAYMTATSSLVVAAIDASTGVRLRYKEGNSGTWTYQPYTDGAYTFSNPNASTEYTFRNYGPETNPEKFPSESVSINTGILFSPDYVAGTITVSVMPATQYEYIYSTTGHPEYAQDEEGEAIQYPTSETLTYTVGADEDYLYVAARNGSTIVRGVYYIQRYATPTAALINYSTTQGTITPNITVTRTDASTDVLRLGYTTSVGSGVNYRDYANGTYTFCNADNNPTTDFTTHTLYYFRNYGPETGATRFPSKAAEVNTHSYILPAIANYIPVKSRNNTSTPASGYIYTEPGGKIYVNYSHHVNGENSPLLDPNPYNPNTYDVAYTPGDHILLNYATFKMVAGPASITAGENVYTGNKLRSAVVTVDTQYCDKDVFCHVDADGTPHYLAISDDNSSVVDVTVFSEKCLWTRDASNNRLYQSRSNRRYYLSRNGSSNSLTAATNVNDAQGKWLKVGGKMCLYTNQTMGLCYNQGWQLSSGTQGDFEVGYRPFHRSVGVSNVYTFHSIDMISPARVGPAGNYYQPYWLAVNADHPHNLWVYARARVNKYTLPPHEYYNFKTVVGQNQVDRHFWLDEYGFGHTSFSELQIGDPTPVYFHSRSAAASNQHPEMFTFAWSVDPSDANYVTLTPSGTNGSDLNVAPNTANALTAPRNIPLQVTVTFNNQQLASASEYVDAVQGSGSSDDVVHLLLEQEETDNVIRPVHATDHGDATFQDGHYYLLRNYHVVPQTQTPYYLSGRYRDGQAYIIDTAEPERLFKVQTVTETENGQTRTYYTFENVALTEEHHLQDQTGNWYLTANTTGNTAGNYWYNTPAVAFGTGTNTNDYQFTVKSYKAADGSTSYFTLTPKNVTSGASLAPHWNYHQRGTTLRYSNPYSSHLVTIEDGNNNRQTTIETPDSTAWCLRWQLESPTFIAPVIEVDGDGNVVITDHAGHQRHLGGYLHYQVKAAPTEAVPNPDWGDVQTHTLLASSYAEGCNCTESSVTLPGLAAGAMVRAWKTPTVDLSYFAVSETTEFTVRQVAKPTFHLDGNHITMSCATPGATIKYCLTSDFVNPVTYSVPIHDYETGHVYTVRATAPNMLASDTAVLHYKPELSVGALGVAMDQSYFMIQSYVSDGSHVDCSSDTWRDTYCSEVYDISAGTNQQRIVDHTMYNIYYSYSNTDPTTESMLAVYDESSHCYRVASENVPMVKIRAIPTEVGSALYRPSKTFMEMTWSQYMTFMDTIISTEPGSRAQFMTTGGENNTLLTTTDLDGRALWIGPGRFAQDPNLVINYETSEYLTLRKDVANGTLSLFLDADNTHHNPTDAQYPTSNQWKWSKEPPVGTCQECRDYPEYYKLSTTLTETREVNGTSTPVTVTYYLVYDRTAGIWKAVEGNSDPELATAPEGCNMQVAYHVTLFDYPGGNEYSVRTLNLYHELPAGSGNWHKLATNSLEDGITNTEAWAALSDGESINLRASFDGVYITYAPNRDINIIKPGYENMRDEANYDNYQPLSQWHYYTTTNDDGQEVGHYVRHYSLVAGYTETPMTDYNDNLTHIRWHRDGDSDSDSDTIGVVRGEQTTPTLPAGTLQSYDARFQYTYDDTHPDRITMKCIASGITAPDFSSVLYVTGYNDRVYVNVDQFKPKFTLRLFAEKPHATDEYPDLRTANRWRFVSNSERHESGEYHYFSVLPETIAQVPSGHDYLEGQPTVGGDPEYTQYSLWEVLGRNGRYHIVPVAQQGKYLIHLPDFGEEVYFRGVEPDHGAYLYDPNSAEAVTFNNSGYQPLYGHDSAFFHFGIRKFQDDAADGHDDYVVVSPYYPRTTGSTTVNAAGYLGAHNHDRDDDWSYAYVGTVPTKDPTTNEVRSSEVMQAALTTDFWSTRWTLEHAYLTAPDIEIAPDGTVTLTHRLQTADNVSSSELANLHLYYFIYDPNSPQYDPNSPQYNSNSPTTVTFNNTTINGDTEKPNNTFNYVDDVTNGSLYDPARKPQVTEGKIISARAVLTRDLTTQLFTYQPHVSRPHHITAEKCATPTVKTVEGSTQREIFNDEGTYNYHIAYTTGDTLAVAMNRMTLDYDNVSRTYPGAQLTSANPYKLSVANADNYNYAIRAYRHNKLQSDILYLVHETPLVLNITGVEYDNADNAIVTLSLTDAFDHYPIADYYRMGYKKNNTAWTPETTQVAVVDNTTIRVTVPLGGGQVLFAAQATSAVTDHPFYTASQEVTVSLVSSNYTGADLAVGQGTQASPYEIANASDFVNAALKINAGASQNFGTEEAPDNRPYATAWYKVTADIDLTGVRYQSIGTSTNKFAGHWNGGYHVLTGLDKPLFDYSNGGHIYNVVIDKTRLVFTGATGPVGAVCCTAEGNTRIYNTGFRNSDNESSITSDGKVAGLVGTLDGNARVVNCYNFAPVTSTGNTAAGIVADAQAAAQSTRTDQKGIVFACVNYAKVDAGNNNVYPIVGGTPTVINGNLNTYNYFNADAGYNVAKLQYDGSFGNEEWALNRVEMVRYILNSNNRRAGWWVNAPAGNISSNNYFKDTIDADLTTIGQWVLDTNIAPYPILKRRYDNNHNPIQYPSIINPDYEAAWRNTANAYEGRRLTDWGDSKTEGGPKGYLKVNIKKRGTKGDNIVTSWSDATEVRYLSITDMDTLSYDYNYAKIQLPYYQDIFNTSTLKNTNIQVSKDNSSQDYIVTGWIITSIKRNDKATAWVVGDSISANDGQWIMNFDYNYANRNSVFKDLYHTKTKSKDAYGNSITGQRVGRVFAQGGYFNVPYGVTEITIEPYWGKAYYFKEKNDIYYTDNHPFSATNDYNQLSLSQGDNDIYGSAKIDVTTNSTIYTNLSTLLSAMGDNTTVYDQAIVLLTDFHLKNEGFTTDKKCFSVTSIDADNNHEPDHVLYHYFGKKEIRPIRFDNIVYADYSMASIANSTTLLSRHNGLARPKGHYEITETALTHIYQFEYSHSKSMAPIILNGGYFDHITSAQSKTADNTLYIHMGGHVYHKQFSPANDPNSQNGHFTKRCPIIITGGEYKELYLSGCLEAKSCDNTTGRTAILYASGGRIGTYASGGHEKINADVKINANHIIADNFFAGGISPNLDNSIQGSITTTLDYSIIHNVFCGGNKFGNMNTGSHVTTSATGTTFNTIYGAGYGGNATLRVKMYNLGIQDPNMYETVKNYYKKGVYFQSVKSADNNTSVTVNGINTDYIMDFFPWSNSNLHCARFFAFYSRLSLASVNDVTTTLTDCTILGNYYGGGNLGQVNGTAKSTLTNCTVKGDVYAGGNAATAPPAVVYDNPRTTDDYPQFVGGVYINIDKTSHADTAHYIWTNTRPSNWADTDYLGEDANGVKYIYADPATADLSTIGVCKKTELTIDGNTVVYGSVYGGGNEAETGNPEVNLWEDQDAAKAEKKLPYTTVVVKGNTHVTGDVVGAGKKGKLTCSTSVTIGAANGSTDLDEIPWVEGDVYGGAYSADVDGYSNVTIYDGVLGPVYGGGFTGSVYKESNVTVLGGHIGYSKDTVEENDTKTVVANRIEIPVGEPHTYFGVFGAGFGFGTSVGKDSHVQIGSSATTGNNVQHTHIYINGSVFGGGEAGQVGTGFEIWHGETVPAGKWYVDGDAGTFRKLTEDEANSPSGDHSFYAQFYKPTFSTTTVSIQAPVKAEGSLTTNIAGAVFGGGRGYYITEDEEHPGTYSSTQNVFKLAIAGAVYGSTEVTIGSENQGENGINIGSVSYYTDRDKAEEYQVIDLEKMNSGAGFWDEDLYVYDVENLKYVKLDRESNTMCKAQTRTGSRELALWHNTVYDDVMYYVKTGRASVVGGGEMGPVYGDKIFIMNSNDSKTDLGRFNHPQQSDYDATTARFGTTPATGNTKVTIYSGTIGDIREGLVNGCVYGGGLRADVDGTSTVDIDGTHAWVRGDVYAGGCMGSVYGYHRANATAEATTTTQNLKKGWVRNAHGGSNLAEHGTGCNSLLVVGTQGGTNDDLLVSESVYGANGYSPSLGTATVNVYSGKIGFVKAGIPINVMGGDDDDRVKATDQAPVGTIVANEQSDLAYEGNVYGGGFGPEARITKTTVHVYGGVMKNGVFGGGELAPVLTLTPDATSDTVQYHFKNVDENGTQIEATTVCMKPNATISIDETTTVANFTTTVDIDGGQMSMVCGGGRGYTAFLPNAYSYTPGLVVGNTLVRINGGTINSENYHADKGGGNVYGGGLEGEVLGNTEVRLVGGTVEGRAFAGGRGFDKAMYGQYRPDASTDFIHNHASQNAGAIYGNTHILVKDSTNDIKPTILCGVYGGGEGLNFKSVYSSTLLDTVARVYGNALVQITGGTLGGGYTGNYRQVTGENPDGGSYAGGRVAPVMGLAEIQVSGTANVAAVYGGNDISGHVYGKGTPATGRLTDTTQTYVKVTGTPTIGHLYGGGNGKYDNFYNNPSLAYMNITKRPVQNKTFVDINMDNGGYIGMAFGGGNQATVNYSEVMLRNVGEIDSVFAGGNSATVVTSAHVTCSLSTTNVLTATGRKHSPNVNVAYLFGGNNQADMAILPQLDLASGIFGKVFGGGNAGAMTGLHNTVRDKDNEIVPNLSTYILVNSANVTVREAMFGGCNHADVRGGTFIDVRQTSPKPSGTPEDYNYGIYQLFGGNDIADKVKGTARIDLTGGIVHKMYGGSNGYYYYEPNNNRNNAYGLDADGNKTNTLVAAYVTGRPEVNETQVNVWGGTVNNSIYGGGYAGDCGTTHVVVNDLSLEPGAPVGTNTVTINGKIYGGGYGVLKYVENGLPHVGNVTTAAYTDLYKVKTLQDAYVYGGGYGGDVQDAFLTVHENWNQELTALYGGCYGSDVLGTTTVNMECAAPSDASKYNVKTIYGGNDYTGNVNHSVLNVRNGRYYKIFGAGNGVYDYPGTTVVPNSEHPVTNFYDGTVATSIYGGGNLGTCHIKGKPDTGTLPTASGSGSGGGSGNSDDNPQTPGPSNTEGEPSTTPCNASRGYVNLSDYAFVQVNIHGGTIEKNVYAGGAGNANLTKPLIHGLKELNMDGGTVGVSVYGGTESLSDGYVDECQDVRYNTGTVQAPEWHYDTCRTTRRPSSILNLVGGSVGNNVYGGGYLGDIYGSVYINVGKQAVEECRAYDRPYGNGHRYTKPTFVTSDEERVGSNLKPSALTLQASIYAGANWGEPDGRYTFDRQGFHGGESRIRVDGQGYFTGLSTALNDLPGMNIHYSLYGAGTSCEGGDVLRDIKVLNYGEFDDCNVTRKLWSIQRADSVMFYNVALSLTGDQDALTAYPSTEYAMIRCDTIVMVDHNIIQIEKPIIEAKHLAFQTIGSQPTLHPTLTILNSDNDLTAMKNLIASNTRCDNTSDVCTLINDPNNAPTPATSAYTTLLVNDGAYIDVFCSGSNNSVSYGDVQGYGYLRPESATQAIVTARCKHLDNITIPAEGNTTTTGPWHANDGGFFALCDDLNTQQDRSVTVEGQDRSLNEFPYGNYGNTYDSYRAWKFGNGRRTRDIAIVAHTDTTQLPNNRGITVKVTENGNLVNKRLAVAMVPLVLPPTEAGNYYTITGGIEVDQDNRELELISGAFLPRDRRDNPAYASDNTQPQYLYDVNMHTSFNTGTSNTANVIYGEWRSSSAHSNDATVTDQSSIDAFYNAIHGDPTHKFGLLITDGQSLSGGCADNLAHISCGNTAALSSSGHFSGMDGYATQKVDGMTNVTPTLDVYLTYDTAFDNTLMGAVKFTLEEKDTSGTTIGTVDVTISISTIMNTFESQKYEMVAMKNGFGYNSYTRRHILPAAMQIRSLYLESLEWQPIIVGDNEVTVKSTVPKVGAVGEDANFLITDTNTALNDDNHFALKISPSEQLSATMATTLGWYDMNSAPIDLYKAAYPNAEANSSNSYSRTNDGTNRLVSLKTDANENMGYYVGTLDGRSSAAIDFTLLYNGTKLYDPAGYRGVVKLHYAYYNQNSTGGLHVTDMTSKKEFTVTLDIRTRLAGDTIYVASKENSITRNGITVYEYEKAPVDANTYGETGIASIVGWNNNNKGKEPNQYLTTFKDALAKDVYEPGDVLCILDSMVVNGQNNFTINGSPVNFIPIIRYSGSNFQLPGAECAYKGPMVVLREQGKLSLTYVIIDGRMTASYKTAKTFAPGTNSCKYLQVGSNYYWEKDVAEQTTTWAPSTLAATAPAFAVKDNAVLTFSNNTIIQNCWNRATSVVYDNDNTHTTTYGILSEAPGAVALLHKTGTGAANPTLLLNNNVTIERNLVGPGTPSAANATDDTLASGAIHVDEGTMTLGAVGKGSKMEIWNNYYLPADYTTNSNHQLWNNNILDATKFQNLSRANVYLEREGTRTTGDTKSKKITFSEDLSANSKIGISKVFPGVDWRDTITIAQVSDGRQLFMQNAKNKNVFRNDGRLPSSATANTFYHPSISSYNLFFQRCASFQKQLYTANETGPTNLLYSYQTTEGEEGSQQTFTNNIYQKPVLQYLWNEAAGCPDGTDSVVFSVHGGFYPYTYKWYQGERTQQSSPYRTQVSRYSTLEVSEDGTFEKAVSSNSDTALTYGILPNNGSTHLYTVTATDLAGCEQTKTFEVTTSRTNAASSVVLSEESNETWVDTTHIDRSVNPNVTHTAKVDRNYKGIYLNATVYPVADPVAGNVTGKYYGTNNGVTLGTDLLCPGDAIQLTATGQNSHSFIQWDFDPYDRPTTVVVMPNKTFDVTAYFGPADYWYQNVTVKPDGFVTDYNGNVHISSVEGLAWLISLCNGRNDQQIHTYYYDTVFLAAGTYDMSAHLWTPLGSAQHPFMGVIMPEITEIRSTEIECSPEETEESEDPTKDGESGGGDAQVCYKYDTTFAAVTINGIIVNEPNMSNVGFFGYTQGATIESLNIKYSIFHGQQYVGGISAVSDHDVIRRSSVTDDQGNDITMITANYCSGGMVGESSGSVITGGKSEAKYMGSAIYNGGVAGKATGGKITNTYAMARPRMSSLYTGGIVGLADGTDTPTTSGTSGSKSGGRLQIVNNYVQYDPQGASASRSGGLVGSARNTMLANNYVYGQKSNATLSGALASVIQSGVHVENCFYEQGFDSKAFGFYSSLDTTGVTSFSGSGSNVILTDTLGSNANLTRQLNKWVYAHGGGNLNYWHSDTGDVNNGYPVFGEPEYQSFVATREVTTCDRYTVEGILCTESGSYQYHAVDSAEFTDTLVTLHLTLNYSEFTELTDTVATGEDYDGNGFHLDAAEIDLMRQALQQEGTVTVVVSDTLQTLAGCDSVVTLYLTVSALGIDNSQLSTLNSQLKVYPNPTTKYVTVEATGLQEVEVYDAVSRKLSTLDAQRSTPVRVDLDGYPAGAYYLRIRTEHGVVIEKVIKR